MEKKLVAEKLAEQIATCKKCPLYKTALNAVPGEGNLGSKIVFVGEAPGATEDQTGHPFVGRAGKLLTDSLNKIGLKREDVWIGNILKHRPPNNREPQPDEIQSCEPFLTVQLRLVKPELVVTLGRFALYYFYKDGKISRDHGSLIKTDNGFFVYPVYHPAAALRRGDMLNDFTSDFLRIPQILREVEAQPKIKGHDNILVEPEDEQKDGQLALNLGIN